MGTSVRLSFMLSALGGELIVSVQEADGGLGGISRDLGGQLGAVLAQVERLARAEWGGCDGEVVTEAMVVLEQIRRRVAYTQARVLNAVEGGEYWVDSGARSVGAWVRQRTGVSRGEASKAVRLSRALRDHLPQAGEALGSGYVGEGHVHVMVREVLKTPTHLDALACEEMGEGFLVDAASQMSVEEFTKVAKHWAIMADPNGAERSWREEGANGEVYLSPTLGGYVLNGFFNLADGQVVEKALNASMGRKESGDARPPAQRRAAALVELSRGWLDSGNLLPGARIRPHMSVLVAFETLQRLCQASGSAIPPGPGVMEGTTSDQTFYAPGGPRANQEPTFLGRSQSHNAVGRNTRGRNKPGRNTPGYNRPGRNASGTNGHDGAGLGGDVDPVEWVTQWQGSDDHVISAAIDFSRMQGVEPAMLEDGTAIPHSVFARLACDSSLMRVVFGPESTILDAGRSQRIFPAHQTRAIIARDRHCQFPGCDEPPQHGEIHHSLWWWKHHGKTNVSQGILLCWHHHGYVHDHNITIARQNGKWIFTTTSGNIIHPPYGQGRETPNGDPPDPIPFSKPSESLGNSRDETPDNGSTFGFEETDWGEPAPQLGDPPAEQSSAPPEVPPTNGWTGRGDPWGEED